MAHSEDGRPRRYVDLVGERLRRIRQERSLSLQDVCDRSGGAFVVSTLSAYERGKRSLSLERLLELAEIYGISATSLLDEDDSAEVFADLSRNRPLRINLSHLDRLSPEERRPLENYLAFLRTLRGDSTREILTIRKDDLAYLSTLYGVRPQTLKDRLEAQGIIG